MEDRQHNDALVVLNEFHHIGEPPDECTANTLVNLRILLRRSRDGTEYGVNTEEKARPGTGRTLSIPIKRIGHLHLSIRTDDKPMTHFLLLIRSLISSHGEP